MGGMHGRGHAWWGCAWQEDMHCKGVCVAGDMCGRGVCMDACMAEEACMAGGMHGGGGMCALEMAIEVDGTYPI